MVSTDPAQMHKECDSWRMNLRSFRSDFSQLREQLQQVAQDVTDQEVLMEVEHFHNQFYIQLVNIHDLNHALKIHEQKLAHESRLSIGLHTDKSQEEHEDLSDRYHTLKDTMTELKDEFAFFANRI
jgi:septum formation inhibitor MinC